MWALLPVSGASGGLSILIPLHILSLGGSVVDVGVASSFYNLSIIPASLLWGQMTDTIRRRRPLIMLSYVSGTILLAMFFFTRSLPSTILLYVIYGFIGAAAAPAVNLLVIETSSKAELGSTFAKSSAMATIGYMIGTLPAAIWLAYFPLQTFVTYLVMLSSFSIALSFWLIPEPPLTLERRVVTKSPESLSHRLFSLPTIFLKTPSLHDFRTFWRAVRIGTGRDLLTLYVAMTFFFIGGSIFFTSYTPLLSAESSEGNVFLAYSFLSLVNTLSFPVAAQMMKKYREMRVGHYAVALRIIGSSSATVSALFLHGQPFFIATFVTFLIMGMAFSATYTSISTIILKILPKGRQGEFLGIYSAITGIGASVGAYASGWFSFVFGYATSFIVATIFVSASLLLLLPLKDK